MKRIAMNRIWRRTISAADFVILDANPLENIDNTRSIDEVYLRGRQVDREGLRMGWTTGN